MGVGLNPRGRGRGRRRRRAGRRRLKDRVYTACLPSFRTLLNMVTFTDLGEVDLDSIVLPPNADFGIPSDYEVDEDDIEMESGFNSTIGTEG